MLRRLLSRSLTPASGQNLRHNFATTAVSDANLNGVLKLDLLQGKSAEDVSALWEAAHADEASSKVGGVMDASQYTTFAARVHSSPMCVLPLVKAHGGAITLFLQARLPRILFTTLEEYKEQGQSAPIHAALTYYTELRDKGIVLARGDILSPAVLTSSEGKEVMQLTEQLYCNPVGYLHVHSFNHQPQDFDYMRLLQHVEQLRGVPPKE